MPADLSDEGVWSSWSSSSSARQPPLQICDLLFAYGNLSLAFGYSTTEFFVLRQLTLIFPDAVLPGWAVWMEC
jgi:hypothetical protein